jgi:hypothetical protein
MRAAVILSMLPRTSVNSHGSRARALVLKMNSYAAGAFAPRSLLRSR